MRFVYHLNNNYRFNPILKPRINNQITARELRVVNDKGENLGVMTREEALKLAMDRGLDLIETVAMATPPVAKLMSYDKFRYEEEKRVKQERKAQKTAELKQVQTSARAAANDLQIKAKQADKFLEDGHPVEIQMRLRGREKAHKDWAKEKLEEFLKMITVEYKRISDVRFGGRGLGIQIIKK